MSPRFLRYAITDRHLAAADQREDDCARDRAAGAGLLERGRPRNSASGSSDNADGAAILHGQEMPFPIAEPVSATRSADFESCLNCLLEQAHRLKTENVDFLQLRERDLPHDQLRRVAANLRHTLARGAHPRLLFNLGRPADYASTLATAIAVHADGLHLPSDFASGLPQKARAAFAAAGLPRPYLSASVHSPAEIARARFAAADLLLFGPVFGKVVHGVTVSTGLGLEALADAVRTAAPLPVLALGGVTAARIPEALGTGARGIASIRFFL